MTLKTPTISVMMPTYNVEKYVAKAIDSVLNQTYQNWELIVVDDGSTDETPNILAKYAQIDSRIQVYFMAHGGRGKARNKCLEFSKGKYIAVCDSDDISLPERFEKQVHFLELNPEIGVTGAQLCAFNTKAVLDRSKIIFWPVDSARIARAFQQNKMKVPNCAAMIRASLFEKYKGYDEQLIRAQDYEFFKRLSLNNICFSNLGEVLVFYRKPNLIPSFQYFVENGKYNYYANYRIQGGQLSFDEINQTIRMKIFKEYLKIQYLWLVSKLTIKTTVSKLSY